MFDVPWENLLVAKEGLYLQTGHGLPLIAGQVTRQTPVNPALLTILQQTLDPALLRAAGADVVIVHRAGDYDADGTLFNRAQQQLGAPTYVDERFAVFDVPASDDSVGYQMNIPLAHDNGADLYLYAPQTGWAEIFALQSDIDPSRQVRFYLDGQPLAQASDIVGQTFIPIAAAGYHTISVMAEPACPVNYAAPLICPFVTPTANPDAFYFVPDTFDTPTQFDHGVTLLGSQLLYGENGETTLLLWWQFAQTQAGEYVRFVKFLDANGEQIAGVDDAMSITEGQVAETLHLPLADVQVYVGWYTYPDLVRFSIVSGGADQRAQDGLAYIGSFTVENP
ncbi:MAG: hypothetical protein U0694_22690 [Anaerolineae bacterium]